MSENDFFSEPKHQSIIKTSIVSKYFAAWARIILGARKKSRDRRIAYIDLFAGPGRYDDDTKSTPVRVIEIAIENSEISQNLVTVFNDKDEENALSLENTIRAIPGVGSMAFEPVVMNHEVGDSIVQQVEKMGKVPTFFFVDPFGYKGLSLRLINSVLKQWGSDCVFFFNYNRINMGLTNPSVVSHIDALFGEKRANELRNRVSELDSDDREALVLSGLADSLREMGGRFVLPFRFEFERQERTSHYLVFVSKDFKGYEVMKDVMSKESSTEDQGVFSFAYTPISAKNPTLFRLTDPPLEILKASLLTEFQGQTLSLDQIYKKHSVDTPYIIANYKEALKQMEAAEQIIADPPADKRRKDSFAPRVRVTFPD